MKKFATSILLFLMCILPLIVNPYGREVFGYPKVALIYSGSLVLLLSLLWFTKFKKIKLNLPVQNKLLLIYLLFCTLSLINSKDISLSLWGHASRREGLLSIACYIFLCLMAFYFYEFDIKHLRYIAMISIPISILALFQYAGNDVVLGMTEGMPFYKNSYSTIGNQNFLGSYVCLVLPLMVFSYMYLKDKLFFFCSCLLFLSLLCSLTRSAWLSLSVLTVLVIILAVKKIIPYTPLIHLMAAFVILFVAFNYFNNNQIVDRYKSILPENAQITDSTGSNRIFIWRRALLIIGDHPLLGTGVDNFAEVFMDKFKEDAEKNYPGTIFDKAHNEYLHIAATTGIPSLAAYLAFWAVLFIKALRHIKTDKKALTMFSCILAYHMQAFFNISVVAVAPVMWIFTGIFSGIVNKNITQQTSLEEGQSLPLQEVL